MGAIIPIPQNITDSQPKKEKKYAEVCNRLTSTYLHTSIRNHVILRFFVVYFPIHRIFIPFPYHKKKGTVNDKHTIINNIKRLISITL